MSAERRSVGVLLLALLGARTLVAQEVRREFGVQVLYLDARTDQVGGGVLGAFRPTPRARIQGSFDLLRGSGRSAERGEVVAHFLLAPRKRTGTGLYVGGGLAATVATRTDGWLVALVGIEGSPGGRTGWTVEGGVGGGWRAAVGWRWRRH